MSFCATSSRLLVRFVSTGDKRRRRSVVVIVQAAVSPSSHLVPFVSTRGGDFPRDTTRRSIQTAASRSMPNGVKKENLPQKICVVCDRPFTWRKKWERCWDEVTTCSKSCNAKRKKNNQREREKGEEGTRGSAENEEEENNKNSSKGDKRCDKCGESRSMLVRCQIDETKAWKMICVKGCWKSVSGGVTDGTPEFPHYKYGGVWKNRRKVSMDGEEKRMRKKEETSLAV